MFREECKDLEAFKAMDPLESLEIFTGFIKDLEKKEAEIANLKKIDIKKKSRIARDQFRVRTPALVAS